MATWVVYHNDASPDILEYVINDIPEGITKQNIQQVLSVTKDCYKGDPRQEVAFSLHGICLLAEAPVNTQAAHGAGQARETFPWIELWTSRAP